MAEMLEVLILALELMNEESSALEINWNKTQIQAADIIVDAPPGALASGAPQYYYSYRAQALQCLYSSGAPICLGHMECDKSVETTS